MTPEISVVIASLRPGPALFAALDALGSQRGGVPFEAILAESSADGTAERAAVGRPWLRPLELDPPALPGRARNAGCRAARGAVVAFLNATARPDPDWLLRIARHFHRSDRGLCGAVAAHGRSPAARALALLEFSDFSPEAPARPSRFAPGGNSAVLRRRALEIPFPERLRCAEDLAWSHAMSAAHGPFRFDPGLLVRYPLREDWGEVLSHARELGRGSAAARRAWPLPGAWTARLPGGWAGAWAWRSLRMGSRLLRRSPRRLGELPDGLRALAAWSEGYRLESTSR